MDEKSKVTEEIKALEEEIKALEFKRSRSMAVVVEALLTQTVPNETDVKFFRRYNAEIEMNRTQLRLLNQQLESLQ